MTTIYDWAALPKYARKKYSQCGEEGILERIFEMIGTTNKVSVEFGCGDGWNLSNTRLFTEQGWKGHYWDCAYENEQIKKHLVTAENVNSLFAIYEIPLEFDLLSIDIDGNDYWVWKALKWQPRVVVIEFNGSIHGDRKCTIPYTPDFRHDATDYYGASFALLCQLGRKKGYAPVCQLDNLNLFFVRSELGPIERIPIPFTARQSHTPDPQKRLWQEFE